MSTEHVPEVSGDESALVPPAPKPEWPKKLRTLTAGELDRLTIDAEGRFYWDGRIVNYEGPKPTPAPEVKPAGPVDPFDRVAQEILDRSALEMTGPRAAHARAPEVSANGPPPAEGNNGDAPAAPAVESVHSAEPLTSVAVLAAAPASEPLRNALAAPITLAYPAHGERVRFSLSFWQSLGLLLTIAGLLLGAAGIAAHGLVTAHEWGCKVGWAKAYCPAPPPPAPAPPPRPDIPA